jgi:hypothetical protein
MLADQGVFLEHNLHPASWQCLVVPSVLDVLVPERGSLHLARSFGACV